MAIIRGLFLPAFGTGKIVKSPVCQGRQYSTASNAQSGKNRPGFRAETY